MKTNYSIRYAANPKDVKLYDTNRLREDFLIKNLWVANEANMTYSMYDRMIVGGIFPVNEPIQLETINPLKANFFLERREIGIVNVGGDDGIINVDGESFNLKYKEALYIGAGKKEITFISTNKNNPTKFYFNSTPAHHSFPTRLITQEEMIKVELGSLEDCNHRVINKMIVRDNVETCQLQMGMTELKTGSVWNTMPAHVHDRRMEAYYYFEIPENQTICHFLGEAQETRHLFMHNEQAVLSPEWSIHSAAATHNYTFIWGMGGENLDYGDVDQIEITALR